MKSMKNIIVSLWQRYLNWVGFYDEGALNPMNPDVWQLYDQAKGGASK